MFTGLIQDVGKVRAIDRAGDWRIEIATSFDMGDVALGASIACSGVCLTVTEKESGWFAVEASAETLSKTTVGDWDEGRPLNLERSLKLGDELGGHLVFGHVDGIAEITARAPDGDSTRFRISPPPELAKFIAPKGCVSVDGVSLTVNEVEGDEFGVNIIPHTLANTGFGKTQVGDRVNLEIDMLARYVARLLPES
ncbi:MAG TPA: riboflavin synthase [Rhodospirillaceae bacterium]|nr:riboflavin synthase [Rhodospirillaceae bacterium]HAA93012.1 riboflavin synthase [Rhodospirillaceae bacterium]HAT34287.1 riboflavin synthase [Rhodospirillaceae bacterium]|tara:strand:- start:119 stop:706 length:588 start_codon:yes stop_codon:yes gene_type:complete